MRSLILAGLAALSLAGAASAEAPALVLRVKNLQGLIDDFRHLARRAGRDKEAQAFEDLLKKRTGPKGLEGVDTKRPFGFTIAPRARLIESEIYLLLPIADEAAFLKFLDSLDMKPKKQADGSYAMALEGVPVLNKALFRFAHGYLYGTLKTSDRTAIPAADKLPKPAGLLGGGDAVVTLTAHVQRAPKEIRELAISFIGLQLGQAKDEKRRGETKAEKALRDAVIDELTSRMKSLLTDAETFQVELTLDRGAADELALSATLTAKKGSALAKDIENLGGLSSVAFRGKGAVLRASANMRLPVQLRKAVNAVINENVKRGLDQLMAHELELVEPIAKAMGPTLRSGTLDAGMQLVGPGKGGRYTYLAAIRIQDGAKVEEAIKATLKKLPEKDRAGVTVDVGKESGVSIHAVKQKGVDEKTKKMFGEGPMYVALRGDAAVVAMGEEALEKLKSALASKPARTGVFLLEGSLERLAGLMAIVSPEMKAAPEAAKEAFKGGGGRVRLAVTGGERLTARLSVQTAVLTYAGLLDKARKKK